MSFSNGWILEFALNKPMNTDTHLLLNTAKTTGPGATVAKAIRALLRTLFQLNGVLILLVILALTACASWLTAHHPLDMAGMPLLPPGQDTAHWLGTDSMGRDVWAGLLYGARTSLFIGVGAASISLGIGIVVGLCAGYFGGWLAQMLNRLTALFQTIPAFLLVIVLVTIYRPTLSTIMVAIGLASWPEIARLTRAECRRIKALEFIHAARSAGFSHRHIMIREILPNALPSIVVSSSILIAHAILMESGLAFLGLSDPNVASWGAMISSGREQLSSAWYLTAIPGVAIALTVLAFNHLGDQLNDRFNPRQRS
ncbi:MAG TPA: ABC transporter permease [Paenalcaligenes sp.]|nr:ABC transporter permease [Paenalcaligenes sp.]